MTVRKEGPNKGKLFWTCPLKEDVRCKFFAWDADWRKAGAGSNCNGAGTSAGTPLGGRNVTVSLQWLSPEQFALEHFPLDQTLTAVLRALPGAECDPADARQWRVPFASHAALKQVLF
jgi:hypothetical protein